MIHSHGGDGLRRPPFCAHSRKLSQTAIERAQAAFNTAIGMETHGRRWTPLQVIYRPYRAYHSAQPRRGGGGYNHVHIYGDTPRQPHAAHSKPPRQQPAPHVNPGKIGGDNAIETAPHLVPKDGR